MKARFSWWTNLGCVLAIVLSVATNHSFWWGFLHAFFGWWYVIYWGFVHANIDKHIMKFVEING